MLIPSLDPQERIPFLCTAVASACAAAGALTARAAADTLFLDYYGPHVLSLMYVGTSVLVGTVAYSFGRYVRRVSLSRILILSCSFLGLVTLLLRVALFLPWNGLRVLAYFWGDLTVNVSTLLFWSLFGLVFDFRRAKRLLGWVGASGTLSCIAAGLLIRPFATLFGTPNLLIVVALLLAGFAAAVFYLTHHSESQFEGLGGASRADVNLPDLSYYLSLLGAPRIRSLALQAMVGTMVIILVDYQFKAVAQAHFQGPRLAAFFGDFYAAANIIMLLIQIFALHLLLQGRGLLTSLCVLPMGMLLGGSATILTASFAAVLISKLVAQTTLFTVDTGAFQILYLGVKKQTRTQVRALVDGICRPAAIGITGAILVLISGAVRVYLLSIPGLLLCLVWFYLARRNYSLYLSGLVESLSARLLDISEDPQGLHGKAVEDYTRQALVAAKLEELPYLLSVVQQLDDIDWSPEIRGLLQRPEPEVKIAALEYLIKWGKSGDPNELIELARHPVAEVRRAAVRAAGLGGETAMGPIRESLEDSDPGVRAEAASALIAMGHFGGLLQGAAAVKGMLESADKSYRMAVASPVSRLRVRGRTDSLLRLLDDPEPEVRLAALRACANIHEAELLPKVIVQLRGTRTAGAAAEALIALGTLTADYLCAYDNTAELADLFRRSVQLPVILEKIGSPRALEALKRVLDFSGPNASVAMVQAYCRMLQRQPSLEPYLEHWESVLHSQIGAAQKRRRLLARTTSLAGNTFLLGVIQEEYATHLGNVFTLLGLRATTVKMEAIRSHLQNGDEEQRARALEVLEHVLPDKWRSEVFELIDSKLPVDETTDVGGLLRAAMESESSEPVLLGALYAAARSSARDVLPLIQQLLSHPSGVVRETALFGLAQVAAPAELARQCRELLADPDEIVRRLAQSLSCDSGKTPQEGGTGMIVVEKTLFLRHVPLFSNMATSELTQVASLAREVTYPAGSRIIQEGEHGDHMFLIVDGAVLIQRGETPLNKLGPRDFFGEMSIIDGEARSATATAVTDCLLLRIDKEDFQELLSTYNSAAVSVVRALNQRLREVLPALERAKRGM
ncbi:MAG: HEAT repeat domain-containing protein [Terriglobia bacterium]